MNREQQEEVQKTVSKLKINKTEEFAAIHGTEHTKASSITGSINSINTQIIENSLSGRSCQTGETFNSCQINPSHLPMARYMNQKL